MRAAAAAVAAVLLALAVRLLWLDGKALWNDEAYSLRVALQPAPEVVSAIAADVHPPLYYLLLHLWLTIAPGDGTGRMLSALAGTAAVAVAWLLARRLLSWPQAAFAAALCAILPFYVSWAQISRGYAVLLLASLVALLAAGEVLRRLERGAAPAGGAGLAGWAAAYVLGGAAALWTHNVGAFLLLGINAAAFWRLLAGQLRGVRPLLVWSACQVAILLLWAPWVPTVLEQSGRFGSDHFVVTGMEVARRIGMLFGDFMLWKLGGIAAAIGLAGAAFGAMRLDLRAAHAQVALAAILVPIGACVLLFLTGRPALGYSVANLIWIPALAAILLAATLRRPARGAAAGAWVGIALAVGFVALTGRGLQNWYASPNPAWDRIAARLVEEVRPGDAILATTLLTADPGAPGDVPMHALALYLDRARAARPQVPAPVRPDPAAGEAELLRWMEGHRRLWVPRFVPMPDATPAMRVVALAERDPARWRVTHEPVQRLGLTRIERLGE